MVDQILAILLPGGIAAISAILAAMVLGQFIKRREFYLFPWGIGLAMFAFVSAFEFATLVRLVAPEEGLFRAYLAMYPISMAVLGLGAVYMAADRRWGHGYLIYVLLASWILLFLTATAPGDAMTLWRAWLFGVGALPDNIRSLSLLLIASGAVALIGGALYSWYKTRWRGNLSIAAGSGLMVLAGILRFVPSDSVVRLLFFNLLVIVGLIVMSSGFLRSRAITQEARAQTVTASVE